MTNCGGADCRSYPCVCGPSGYDGPDGPRSWSMHAEYHAPTGSNAEEFYWHFGEPRYVRAYGGEPVPVTLTEDPEGRYYGWLRTGGDVVEMVQPHRTLFEVQFTYGPQIEMEAGRGEIVRLSVTPDEPVACALALCGHPCSCQGKNPSHARRDA